MQTVELAKLFRRKHRNIWGQGWKNAKKNPTSSGLPITSSFPNTAGKFSQIQRCWGESWARVGRVDAPYPYARAARETNACPHSPKFYAYVEFLVEKIVK